MYLLKNAIEVPVPRHRVFAFFANAENLGEITPPELDFRIVSPLPVRMHEGALIDYRIGLWGFPMKWRTLITRWNPPYEFTDEQLRGPYMTWIHSHRFTRTGAGTLIEDEVSYELPLGTVGKVALPLVRRQLERIFSYRSRRIAELLLPRGSGIMSGAASLQPALHLNGRLAHGEAHLASRSR